MDQIIQVGEAVTNESNETIEHADKRGQDIRRLSDLELVLAAGGDGIVYWP
jgi:hypothetical protein